MSEVVLSLDAVGKRHGKGESMVVALDSVDLTVVAGELVAVMGPSGSGKSTLLNVAGSLDQPDEGTVTLAGRDIGRLNARRLAELRRTTVGFVFQDLNLIPSLTALENVTLPLELDGIGMRDAAEQGRRALEEVGIAELADRFPEEMSGGQQQRTAIARAVVGDRSLVLADEPTGALDSVTGASLLAALRASVHDLGQTVVMVTHDPSAASYADEVVLLADGRLRGRLTEPTSDAVLDALRGLGA